MPKRVAIDSREVQPGDVFWALPGQHHDGAEFADEAFQRGAAGAVVHRPVEAPAGRWVLEVRDTLESLQQWAAWKRRRFGGAVVAVTGSVGKTTTRQMIHTVLKSRLCGTASPRNFNNEIGLPLSILQIELDDDYAVLNWAPVGPAKSPSWLPCANRLWRHHPRGRRPSRRFRRRRKIAEAKAELLAALPLDGCAVLGDGRLAAAHGLAVQGPGHVGRPQPGVRPGRCRRRVDPRPAEFPRGRLPVLRAGVGDGTT